MRKVQINNKYYENLESNFCRASVRGACRCGAGSDKGRELQLRRGRKPNRESDGHPSGTAVSAGGNCPTIIDGSSEILVGWGFRKCRESYLRVFGSNREPD